MKISVKDSFFINFVIVISQQEQTTKRRDFRFSVNSGGIHLLVVLFYILQSQSNDKRRKKETKTDKVESQNLEKKSVHHQACTKYGLQVYSGL